MVSSANVILNLGIGDDATDKAALNDEREDHDRCVDCDERVDSTVEVVVDKEGVNDDFGDFETNFPHFGVGARPDTDDGSFRSIPTESLKLELTWRGAARCVLMPQLHLHPPLA